MCVCACVCGVCLCACACVRVCVCVCMHAYVHMYVLYVCLHSEALECSVLEYDSSLLFVCCFDSFGGSLDFLMNQTSSMPALKTMIEYYKDIFCDHPLGQGGMG